MKPKYAAWQAELTRLANIQRRYKAIRKQVKEAREDGVRCFSRTNEAEQERYWLVDKEGRILTGEYASREEAFLDYLEEKK